MLAMRTLLLTGLLYLATVPGEAMISVENVTVERAEELGVTFRVATNGVAGLRVWVEARSQNELAKITYAEVQVGEGKGRIMSAHLRERNLKSGRRTYFFSVHPEYLLQSSVLLAVYQGPRGDVGYHFRLKDFLQTESKKIRP